MKPQASSTSKKLCQPLYSKCTTFFVQKVFEPIVNHCSDIKLSSWLLLHFISYEGKSENKKRRDCFSWPADVLVWETNEVIICIIGGRLKDTPEIHSTSLSQRRLSGVAQLFPHLEDSVRYQTTTQTALGLEEWKKCSSLMKNSWTLSDEFL